MISISTIFSRLVKEKLDLPRLFIVAAPNSNKNWRNRIHITSEPIWCVTTPKGLLPCWRRLRNTPIVPLQKNKDNFFDKYPVHDFKLYIMIRLQV